MQGCGPDRRQIPPGETIAAWVIIAKVPHADVARSDMMICVRVAGVTCRSQRFAHLRRWSTTQVSPLLASGPVLNVPIDIST